MLPNSIHYILGSTHVCGHRYHEAVVDELTSIHLCQIIIWRNKQGIPTVDCVLRPIDPVLNDLITV